MWEWLTIQILLLTARMLTVYFHNNMIINKLFILYIGCLFLSGTGFGKNKLKLANYATLLWCREFWHSRLRHVWSNFPLVIFIQMRHARESVHSIISSYFKNFGSLEYQLFGKLLFVQQRLPVQRLYLEFDSILLVHY